MRKFEFQTGEFYHIYNRGVDKREVFLDKWDYVRFLRSMREFNRLEATGGFYRKFLASRFRGSTPNLGVEPLDKGKLADIIAYCLNPNHYHFLLKQMVDGGISEFLKRLSGGYTSYFNFKNNRSGYLFQGRYKAIHVKSDSYLLWLSGYINGNAEIHRIAKAENWIWGSYLDYTGKRRGMLCNKNIILSQFETIEEYRDLVNIIIRESSQGKEELKKYLPE